MQRERNFTHLPAPTHTHSVVAPVKSHLLAVIDTGLVFRLVAVGHNSLIDATQARVGVVVACQCQQYEK